MYITKKEHQTSWEKGASNKKADLLKLYLTSQQRLKTEGPRQMSWRLWETTDVIPKYYTQQKFQSALMEKIRHLWQN